MACTGGCGKAASSSRYPYEAVMPDGAKVLVSSAAHERVEREKAAARMSGKTSGPGYTARNA